MREFRLFEELGQGSYGEAGEIYRFFDPRPGAMVNSRGDGIGGIRAVRGEAPAERGGCISGGVESGAGMERGITRRGPATASKATEG